MLAPGNFAAIEEREILSDFSEPFARPLNGAEPYTWPYPELQVILDFWLVSLQPRQPWECLMSWPNSFSLPLSLGTRRDEGLSLQNSFSLALAETISYQNHECRRWR